jgi:CheY-specific phosphatase CheX
MDREEIVLDFPTSTPGCREPVPGDLRQSLLEPFIAATCAALGEMANTEVAVAAVYRQASTDMDRLGSDISVVLGLPSPREGSLILSFPKTTASALGAKILAGVTDAPDEALVRDCVREIANVVAGQAKALLAESPYRFTFSLPAVLPDGKVFEPQRGHDCLSIDFRCDAGQFAMRLFIAVPGAPSA